MHPTLEVIKLDNTNWRAVYCFHMEKVIFRWATQKTEGQAYGLHKKAVWRAAEKGGCAARLVNV